MDVEIRVLGGVDALVDGRALPLRGSKQRAVLAMLALRANRTVGADELIDGMWADHPPAGARDPSTGVAGEIVRKGCLKDRAGMERRRTYG
jgi:hypothetical protein